jgi:amino acid adenylation domain-containing protein/thioester reductase-like protein
MTSAQDKLGALSQDKAKLLELLLEKRAKREQQIKPCPRGGYGPGVRFPTSYAQRSLWFISQMAGGGAAYNLAVLLRFHGDLDVACLQQALDSLVQRHEALRTVFLEVDGEPMQEVAADARAVLQQIDLSEWPPQQFETHVEQQRVKAVSEPFDLRNGPLIRASLLRVRADLNLLLVTMQHIVSDGWSIALLTRELVELYRAYSERCEPALSPLPVQYVDYAQWQREWLRHEVMAQQLSFWREQLEGAAPELELPKDRPRPPAHRYRGQNVRVVIEPQLTADLLAMARRNGLTLFMALYSAWAILLARLSGQEDIVIGTAVANRRRPEFESLIGLFVNTLALRVGITREQELEQLFEQVRSTTLSAYDHQDVPFEQLVEALRPARSLNRHPIFQVMFVLRSSLQREWRLPGLIATVEDGGSESSKFDLLLSLEERHDQIVGSLNYDTDIFDRATAERWVASLLVLLRGMTTAERCRVGQLPILATTERRQVTQTWNATQAPFPREKLIHQAFQEQVRRTPAALAVVSGGLSLTYEELNGRANQLARHLRANGVRADQPVAICVERGVELMVGLLGILKAGGAYVPLDPSYPIERLRHILADSKPRVVLTQERQKQALAFATVRLVTLDEDWPEVAEHSPADLDTADVGVMPHHLAYVIYTSGSTGRPKGVMVEHRNVLSLWQGLENVYRQSPACVRIAVNASVNFDASVKQLVQLLSGRTLVMVPQEIRWDASLMLRFIAESRIDCIDCTPSQLKTWVAAGMLEADCRGPRLVLIGGEPIDPDLWRRLARSSLIEFYNVYGPTESTVDATFARLRGDATGPHIGRAMQNRQIYILDAYQEPAPIGVIGEMYIGGAGVARGYLNRPELTRELFVADPFGAEPDGRLYRTGDLARRRADGVIEYLGRNDQQVKIRGIRVELGEIEAQLTAHSDIAEAVVSVREDISGDARLVAYAVPHDAAKPTAEIIDALRLHLRRSLPEYMVPRAFVCLESLPLSANGKIDRRALPPPELGAYVTPEYEPPADEIEERLARLWRQLLGVERVGRNANFFDQGGHSLLVLKALFRTKEQFQMALTVADFYRNPTIAELAVRIRGVAADDRVIDLAHEAGLDPSIRPDPTLQYTPAGALLLTGATGFVGRFLLVQLLEQSTAPIYCLVRARSRQQAAVRLRTELCKWNLWRREFEQRVLPIAGDLRLPHLGLDEDTYALLCRDVSTIYHCATSMNHLETYAMAKPTNVGSTLELLRVAMRQRLKVINYVSTLSVFAAVSTAAARVVNEATSIDGETNRNSQGYAASKWVAERIFMTAAQRGVPCNIFRLGLVWADAQHGRYDELQRVYRVLKSCLLTGLGIRSYRFEMDPLPVDYVAQAIGALAHRYEHGGGVFHICSSGRQEEGLFERCNAVAGASLQLLSYYQWIRAIKQLHERGRSMPAAPLVEFAFSMSEDAFEEWQRAVYSSHVRFDADRTNCELEQVGLVAPVLSDELLGRCIADMISRDDDLKDRDRADDSPALARAAEGGARDVQ